MTKITIITPCYYNELNISGYGEKMIENEKIFPEDVSFEYLLIDDGSKDNTWSEMVKFQEKYPDKVKIIKLIRNFGSTNAVFSSLPYSTGDCNVIISADLQDPPELILKMYENWKKGFKLVIAHRTGRGDSFVSKVIANTFHFLIKKFALKNLPSGGFDLNLFDREIKDLLIQVDDKNTFFPYLLLWFGHEYVSIPYVRRKRELGKSSYTLSKKIKIFIDSFVAFSFFPLRMISVCGLVLGLLAFAYGLAIFFGRIFGLVSLSGWSSMMIVLLFVSAFQMIAIGIIGEYIWRTLEASRNRPNFIVDKKIGNF